MVDFIANTYQEWEAGADADKQPFTQYAAKSLAKHIDISTLSDTKLMELGVHCKEWAWDIAPISSRIILCGSKTQIINPQPGDTIITSEGVWQIDSNFQEQHILSKKEMTQYLPANQHPISSTPLELFLVNDNQTEHDDDLPNITKGKQFTTALNQAILKKGRGLYLGTQTSTQRTTDVLRILHNNQITAIFKQRNLSKHLLKQLSLNSDIQFIRLATQAYQDCIQAFEKRGIMSSANPVTAEDTIIYINAVLARKLHLQQLSDTELKMLAYACYTYEPQFSAKIHCAGSVAQLDASKIYAKGDTIILPEGVWQIDYTGQFKQLLNKQAMTQHIPERFIPNPTADITTINSRTAHGATNMDEAMVLTEALNTALQNKKPSALYLGQTAAAEPKEIMDLLNAVTYLTQKEMNRRTLRNPLILKILGLKNDVEFMHYWTRLYSNFMEDWKNANPDYPPDAFPRAAYATYISTALQKSGRVHLATLSDAELILLHKQCDSWSPSLSPRILFCHTIPADYHIGDTLILPTGVYQMRVNSAGTIIQETIIDARNMQKYPELLANHPTSKTEVLILDQYSKKDQAKALTTLRDRLNPIIREHTKGMYLRNIGENAEKSHGAIPIALKNLVEQEQYNRLLHRYQTESTHKSYFEFSGFFPSIKKGAPASSKMDTKQLRAATQQLKALQDMDPLAQQVTPSPAIMLLHSNQSPAKPRTLVHVETAIQEVIRELHGTLGEDYQPQQNTAMQTIQVLQNSQIIMEANPKTVAVYKPLLKAKIDNERKAELFLQALGIPPTHGKDKISVHGGHHALRKAIRSKFQEYKNQEQEQASLNEHKSSSKFKF